jgi:signal peptide peptidase SppA
MDTIRCYNNHMGAWLACPQYMRSTLAMIKSGVLKAMTPEQLSGEYTYDTVQGVAVVPLNGPLMKQRSKYGGTSTVEARRAIRQAVSDPNVNAIMLHIDSPGGTVAGNTEIANEVAAAGKKKKVYAHIDDMGASAAYWIASQATRITANPTAMVGSIGVYSVVYDTSKAADMQGVKVHVISSGEFKGAGMDGTEVNAEMIAEEQRIVDQMHDMFVSAVVDGRQMSKKDVTALADGRVWLGAEAKKLGLVDAVMSFDEALGVVIAKHQGQKRRERAELEIEIAARKSKD